MKRFTGIYAILFILALMPSCAQQSDFIDFRNDFAKQFKADLIKNNVANASYAVFSKDSIIYQDQFSAANSKNDGNATFLIGSVTKVFTAVAIMQLYEQGKIDIDKPVSDYVPDFKIKQRFPESAPITIRSVLTHHAGLPSDSYLHKFSKNPHNFNEILPFLNSQYTTYPAGKIRSYSNAGYALLGMVVERVSGLDYKTYIQKQIFDPLGMKNSGFFDNYHEQTKIAVAYDSSGKQQTEYPIHDQPAGSIYATVNDMILFCRSFINGKNIVLKRETMATMFEIQNRDNLLDLDHRAAICFNFKNKAYEIGRILEHGGATMYHRAQIIIAPDAGLAAVMLADSPNGIETAWKLDEQLMVEYCKQHGIRPDKSLNPEKNMQFTPISSKNLKTYSGNYAMPGMVCRFDWKNDYLSPTINGEQFYLVQEDSNAFVPAKRFMGILFKSKKMYFLLEEIYGEKHFIQAMPWGGLTIIGTQINTKPITEIWKQRTGNYILSNIDNGDLPILKNVSIATECGFLVLKYEFNAQMTFGQQATLALNPASDNEAFVYGYGRGGGEGVIFAPDGKSFSYMGLKFERN